MLLHGSCVARGADAVLLLGPPGAGKSDLALRLLQQGWDLVADDQVVLTVDADSVMPSPPAALRGLLEVRGLGIFQGVPVSPGAPRLRLVAQLAPRDTVPRLPEPARWYGAGVAVPMVTLHGFDASAPTRLAWALDAATGHARQASGAFAA